MVSPVSVLSTQGVQTHLHVGRPKQPEDVLPFIVLLCPSTCGALLSPCGAVDEYSDHDGEEDEGGYTV